MWYLRALLLTVGLVSTSWAAGPQTLEELEKLPLNQIHQSIEPMIAVCIQKIEDENLSNQDRSEARKLKRLLSHLPPQNPTETQREKARRGFVSDYALPGEQFFDSYISEQQKTYWRIFLRICMKYKK